MTTEITKQFIKASSKIPVATQRQVAQAILNVRQATTTTEINNLKSLYAKKNRLYYRIRVGEYRIGVQVINNVWYFQTIDARGDFYKTYPPK